MKILRWRQKDVPADSQGWTRKHLWYTYVHPEAPNNPNIEVVPSMAGQVLVRVKGEGMTYLRAEDVPGMVAALEHARRASERMKKTGAYE